MEVYGSVSVEFESELRLSIGLNIFYSEEKDWARHTTQQCPLQVIYGHLVPITTLSIINDTALYHIRHDVNTQTVSLVVADDHFNL